MRVALLCLLALLRAGGECRAQSVPRGDVLPVSKCCAKGEQIDAALRACVARPGLEVEAVAEENLPPGHASTYWMPPEVSARRLLVDYNIWKNDRLSVQKILPANGKLVLRVMGVTTRRRKRDIAFLRKAWGCLDATPRADMPLALVLVYEPTPVAKCCARGQRLAAGLRTCEADPQEEGARPGGKQEDKILDTAKDPRSGRWLPEYFQGDIVRVRYGESSRYNWTLAVDADAKGTWTVLKDGDFLEEMRLVVRDAAGQKRVATRYCFDAAAPAGRHVLLALEVALSKCCRKGEQFDAGMTRCVPLADRVVEQTEVEVLDTAAAYWLPPYVRSNIATATVSYNWIRAWDATYVFRAEQDLEWSLKYAEALNSYVFFMDVNALDRHFSYKSWEFCFEAVEGGALAPRVVAVKETYEVLGHKCCASGQALSPAGRCESHDGADWSPLDSVIAPHIFHSANTSKRFAVNGVVCNTFHPLQHAYPEEFLFDLFVAAVPHGFSSTLFCADLQRGADGQVRETVASCLSPPSAPLYEAARPLQVVAAVLLAAAVVTVLARERTRTSTHGRALACHAICLMAANALQAAWFFTHRTGKDCSYFAYAIYFFLMGSAWWLNVISINMAKGFRRPQGARKATTGRKDGDGWKRMVLISLYPWGCTAALTALCVGMSEWKTTVYKHGFIIPSFLETKTCFTEFYEVKSAGARKGKPLNFHPLLGEVLYYFLPVTVLVVANAVCLGLTICKIRELQSHKEMLKNTSHTLRSSVVYVKLLLTAGVLELVLEVVAWGMRQQPDSYRRLEGTHLAFRFAIVGSFLELARAFAVLWLCVGSCSLSSCSLSSCGTAALSWLRRSGEREKLAATSSPSINDTNIVTQCTHL